MLDYRSVFLLVALNFRYQTQKNPRFNPPPPQVKSWESSPLKAFNDGFKLLNFWVHNGLQLLSGHDVLVGTWKEMPDVESPVCFLEIRMIWCDLCMCDYVCVN